MLWKIIAVASVVLLFALVVWSIVRARKGYRTIQTLMTTVELHAELNSTATADASNSVNVQVLSAPLAPVASPVDVAHPPFGNGWDPASLAQFRDDDADRLGLPQWATGGIEPERVARPGAALEPPPPSVFDPLVVRTGQRDVHRHSLHGSVDDRGGTPDLVPVREQLDESSMHPAGAFDDHIDDHGFVNDRPVDDHNGPVLDDDVAARLVDHFFPSIDLRDDPERSVASGGRSVIDGPAVAGVRSDHDALRSGSGLWAARGEAVNP